MAQHPVRPISSALFAVFIAFACRPSTPASTPASAPALHPEPVPTAVATDRDGADLPAPEPSVASKIAGWRSVYVEQAGLMLQEDVEPGDLPDSDTEALEWLCRDESNAPLCDGPPPWAVSIRANGQWAWLVVGVDGGRLVHSDLIGHGSLGRCRAATSAHLERSEAELTLVVEDNIEFPDYECDCEEGIEDPDPENCDCYTSCGTPVTTRCRIGVDRKTLELSAPEGECSARAAGARLGLSE